MGNFSRLIATFSTARFVLYVGARASPSFAYLFSSLASVSVLLSSAQPGDRKRLVAGETAPKEKVLRTSARRWSSAD